MDAIPQDSRKLRACLLCSLVKTLGQFKTLGCENCDAVLRMKGSIDRVYECTSPSFTGLVGSSNTSGEQSWVARWQRIEDLIPGVYAVSVQGRLPEDIQAVLERKGIYYRPRDNYT